MNRNVLSSDGTPNDKDFISWTPIGFDANLYTGTFDGAGHTVSGLYFSDTSVNDVGLFGFIGENSKISNVGVVDSYFSGSINVGGVCGCNEGGTINNCYNTSKVYGNNSVGGVCGLKTNACPVYDSYNIGKVRGISYVGAICGSDKTIQNCYYLEGCNAEDTTFTNTAGTSKTIDQFASGEVAYLLQGTQTEVVWGQNIDNGKPAELHPVLAGAKVYMNETYAGCANEPGDLISTAYSNTQENTVYAGHTDNDNDCICDYCGSIVESSLKVTATMVKGAALRLTNGNGLRFYTLVDSAKIAELQALGATVELGTLIAPKTATLKEILSAEAMSR